LEGRALYEEIAPVALAMEAELFGALSPQERATLDDLLRRVEAAATRQGG
jgi:DNA-binding MarR family transcriptional regulator